MTERRNTIYVTGSGGQLGCEIRDLRHQLPEYRFVFLRHEDLDIADEHEVELKLAPAKNDIIINAAAYTAVDRAEDEPDKASKANHIGPKNLARLAEKSGCLLIHISTDYVFDGESPRPYKEEDATGPRSVYGTSKLEGEKAILQSKARALIIRTSWVYSRFGKNFVKTMLELGRKKGNVSVIFEQSGSPTYARDLAKAILSIIQGIPADLKFPQIYHYSNEGAISWYDFAKAIFELANVECNVSPIESKDYPLRAARPVNSVLNKAKIKRDFQLVIPYWRDSLRECLIEMQKVSQ
ncbi:MAG: dTDP-4-dehydrorhamnose reductase [Rhodomicrobium sp.]